jgi:Zn-dependent protease
VTQVDRNPYPPARPPVATADHPPEVPSPARTGWRRALAPLAVVGALGLKFKTVALALFKLKFFATSASMLVSVAGYAVFWGWKFAVGFVLLLVVHEMGHVLEAKRQGLNTGGVYFIPFLGAIMMLKEHSKDAAQAAWLGLGGPILGSAAALVTWLAGLGFESDLLVALGFTGFLLNLFNLIPVMPLDGGWATAVFHPMWWVCGLGGLVVLFLVFPSPIIAIVIVIGAGNAWKRWKHRHQEESAAYYAVTPGQRAAIASVYLSLAALLALGMSASHQKRDINGREVTSHAGAIAVPSNSWSTAAHHIRSGGHS